MSATSVGKPFVRPRPSLDTSASTLARKHLNAWNMAVHVSRAYAWLGMREVTVKTDLTHPEQDSLQSKSTSHSTRVGMQERSPNACAECDLHSELLPC